VELCSSRNGPETFIACESVREHGVAVEAEERAKRIGVLSLSLSLLFFLSTMRRRNASKPISQTKTTAAIACSRESARSAISASIETISSAIPTSRAMLERKRDSRPFHKADVIPDCVCPTLKAALLIYRVRRVSRNQIELC